MTTPDAGRSRKPRRATLGAALAWVAAICLAAFVALVMHSVQTSNQRLADGQAAQAEVITRLSAGLDTTRQQLQQHGVKPSAPPAQSIVGGVPGVPGAAGAQGIPGVAGSPGIQGAPGRTGAKGDPGAASTVPGPAGQAGAPGADSTVPGPAGAQGDPGPAGAAGQDGKDGTNGRDGANGQPPAGWTYTWTDGTGVTHQVTCARTADSPDSAPQYACQDTAPGPSPTATATSSSAASSNRSALGAIALASSAMYRKL